MKYTIVNRGGNIEVIDEFGACQYTFWAGTDLCLFNGDIIPSTEIEVGESVNSDTGDKVLSIKDSMLLLKPTKELIELKKAGFNV